MSSASETSAARSGLTATPLRPCRGAATRWRRVRMLCMEGDHGVVGPRPPRWRRCLRWGRHGGSCARRGRPSRHWWRFCSSRPCRTTLTRRLAAGLTDDLITDLTRFREFGVLARNTTRRYADTEPRRVRDELGAQFVVTGSIDRQDGAVRVIAQLADAGTGGSLWSERWDRPDADFFAVQSEIAETLANRLGRVVAETGRMAASRKPPESLTAYELYLLGSEQLGRFTRPSIESAYDLLRRAVELDPGLARAWSKLYFVHKQLANVEIDPERNRELAIEAAERAVALDPSDPEAHVVHGSSFGIRDDFVRAQAEYETALRMAPNSADILTTYIGWASSFGDAERGAELVERAIRLDPNHQRIGPTGCSPSPISWPAVTRGGGNVLREGRHRALRSLELGGARGGVGRARTPPGRGGAGRAGARGASRPDHRVNRERARLDWGRARPARRDHAASGLPGLRDARRAGEGGEAGALAGLHGARRGGAVTGANSIWI